MGKISNLLNAKVSGNVGAMNFRRRGADTVVAERSYTNSSGGKGASEAQRLHRCRLANIVGFFRAIQAIEAKSWEGKAPYVSDFNMLSKVNLATSPVFFTKEEAQLNASVMAPYIVSRGTLKSLGQYYDDTTFVTGVFVGSNTDWPNITVAQLSEVIITNNEGWLYGDKLSFAGLRQNVNVISGVNVPQIAVVYFELTLDPDNNALVWDLPNAAIVQVESGPNGNMAFLEGFDAGFAIHSRRTSGVLETSEQRVIMQNPYNYVYQKYTSNAQRQLAMDSYGYQGEVLLTPGSEGRPDQPNTPVFSGVTLAGAPVVDGGTTTVAGELRILGENLTSANCELVVNGQRWSPQSVSSTALVYVLDHGGTFVVYLNGVIVFRWTATVPATDFAISKVALGGTVYTGTQSGLTVNVPYDSGSVRERAVIYWNQLAEVTANGCTFDVVSIDNTDVTLDVNFTLAGSGDWSILANGVVALSGRVNASI